MRAVGIVQQLTGSDAEVSRAALEQTGWVVKDAWQRLTRKPSSR
jgi:N-acetylmuramic acid 6-phosphate (MurNAc-6-P) etherase